MKHFLLIAFILPLASHALAAETFTAHVVGVLDGDTLRVIRREGGTIKVRLYGIDCPEKGQRYGKEARRLAHRLSYGRVVFTRLMPIYFFACATPRYNSP